MMEAGARIASSHNAFFYQSVMPVMKNANGKAVLFLALGFAVLFSYFMFFDFLDLRSYISYPTFPSLVPPSCPPIKVYMYDLHPRFNFAMLDRNFDSSSDKIPNWPVNSGIKRQHSVEYWLTFSLMWRGKGNLVEAVRVSNPDEADAFFVPFFSSLSFNTHGKNMTDPDTEKDRILQVELMNILHNSKYWQRSNGSDHIIPMTHPNAFRFLRDQLNSSILIVADFGRYPPTLSNLRKDVVSPYVHIVESFSNDDVSDPFSNRTTLLFFRGNTIRKDEGRVRAELEMILSGHDDVIYERSVPTMETIKASTLGMRSSKFCLHPAGDTPSSCRLFDAIVSHCVPVIVSDQIELPFEDEIDYSEFALFFSVREAIEPGFLVEELRRFPKEKWMENWMKMKKISKHFEFQFPPKRDDAVNMLWRQIKHKLPAVHLSDHRKRRLKVPDWWT